MTAEEKAAFINILFEFEGAIAFDDSEMGCLGKHIEPPIYAHTVPHVPWQQQNLRLPRVAQEEATKIIKRNLASGVLEFSQGPYCSRYSQVQKSMRIADFFTSERKPAKIHCFSSSSHTNVIHILPPAYFNRRYPVASPNR